MTEYVMIDRELLLQLQDYMSTEHTSNGERLHAELWLAMNKAPQQAAEPVAIAKTRREFHDYENSALEDDTGYLVTHVVWVKDPQDIGEIKLYAGHPPAQPEQPAPIPTSERLPTKADADWMGFIYAFASDGSGWGLWEWIHVADDPDYLTHWLPTGLTRPAAPDSGDVL